MNDNSDIETITICSIAHIDVWKLTSVNLLRLSQSKKGKVYVPSKELELFKHHTPHEIEVLSQDSLDDGFVSLLKKEIIRSNNDSRYGWYLQQLYKIEALIKSQVKYPVIWDADCVPTNKICFYNSHNQPLYMKATERNIKYYETISRLLKIDPKQNFSFVIPGFPIPKIWISEFIEYLESIHRPLKWYEAIIHNTNLSLKSGFSETETLGTWLINFKYKELQFIDLNWNRNGQSRFGYARKFTPKEIEQIASNENLDIVSFENWDLRGYKLKLRRTIDRSLKILDILRKMIKVISDTRR